MRRVPSIQILLALASLALIVPSVLISVSEWQDGNARVRAAERAEARAEVLAIDLHLAHAVSEEALATSGAEAVPWFGDAIPDGALAMLGLDFRSDLVAARVAVDELLEQYDDPALEAELAALRRAVDVDDLSVAEVLSWFDVIRGMVAATVEADTDELFATATATEASGIIEAVGISRSAANVQQYMYDMPLRWITFSLGQDVWPMSVVEVREFDRRLAAVDIFSAQLDDTIDSSTLAGSSWIRLGDQQSVTELLSIFDATVRERAQLELPLETVEVEGIDTSSLDDFALLSAGAQIIEALDLSATVSMELKDLVDASLQDVRIATDAARADAIAAHDTTVLRIGGLVALLVAAEAVMLGLVLRPINRMASFARALGEGELQARLPESGPREIRTAARALNEAVSSLEQAEAQAIALAEERLDDPTLSAITPGRLGASLQAAVARLTSSLLERETFQRRLAHEAAHDGLTKLHNRSAVLSNLEAALARTRRSESRLALLVLDLDEFKAINDSHGHQAGDAVLRAIAQRLMVAIRQGDVAGRLGGDEFVVIAEPVGSIDEAVGLSRRIIDEICRPVIFNGTAIRPSVSVGIALAENSDLSSEELLRDADLAVYRARSRGRGRVDICDDQLRAEMHDRTTLEQAISDAIGNDEFVVHYQPTMDSVTGRPSSLEALIRWNRPGQGLVQPDSFIPAAERTDLIIDIDRWVLHAVAGQLSEWSDHPSLRSLPVAVNISGRHLTNGSLVTDVENALASYRISSDRVILEVTETAVLDDVQAAALQLAELRRSGVRVALDDFGTGYMSLAHLRGLPVDILKIDRSFIADLDSPAGHSLVKLIVDTGHLLGVTVTAEGVETAIQAQMLAGFGSDNLQGHLFSGAVEASAIENTLSRAMGAAADAVGSSPVVAEAR